MTATNANRNPFSTFDQIITLARAAATACPEQRTKHSAVLEKALSGNFASMADRFTRGAAAFAADGILDEAELYTMALWVSEMVEHIQRAVEIGRTFVMPGFIVAERDGFVALCYGTGGGCPETWEACTTCPKGLARFVPAAFHRGVVEAFRLEAAARTPRNTQAIASINP